LAGASKGRGAAWRANAGNVHAGDAEWPRSDRSGRATL